MGAAGLARSADVIFRLYGLDPFRPVDCNNPARCRANPAVAADCYQHRWDVEVSPLSLEPASAQSAMGRAAIARDPRAPQSLLRDVYSYAPAAAGPLLLLNPSTPDDLLERLARHAPPNAQALLVASHRIDIEALVAAASTGSGPIAGAAAGNPRVPSELFEAAFRNSTDPVRQSLARNTSCPQELLSEHAADSDHFVRAAIAVNLATPSEVRAGLSRDPMPIVRAAAAAATRDPELMDHAVHERSLDVRAGAALNPWLPEILLDELLAGRGREPSILPRMIGEHRNVASSILVDCARACEWWDEYDDNGDFLEDRHALESRVVTWLRRSRGIEWDDGTAIEDLCARVYVDY